MGPFKNYVTPIIMWDGVTQVVTLCDRGGEAVTALRHAHDARRVSCIHRKKKNDSSKKIRLIRSVRK